MLERAAGCLENAGRRFFRDSNGAIRSRRAFYSSAVHYSPTNLELHHGVPITQSPQRPASNDLNAIAPSNDTRTPVLDFLYPLPTQEFAASCLLHAQRRLVPRRRRKTSPSLARHYTSQAPDLEQSDELDLLDSEKTSPFADEQDAKKTHVERLVPPEDDDSEIYDGAWDRYVAAGRPPQVNSALLAFLSRSHTDKDFRRARSVFNIISPESRSPEDYVHMVKSALATDRLLDAKIYCEEAISNGIGIKCWAFLLAHYVSDFQWDWAQEIWDLESSLLENDRARTWIELAPHFDMSTFEDPLVDLADFTRELTRHTSLHDLARFFFDSVCSSQDFVEKSSIDGILLVLQKYNNLNLLRPAHYINILNLLRKSESRQIFIRSVVIYRNYRWKMDGRVSAKLLGHLVRGLSSFQITTGLLYFLDEFTHFYGKPSLDAYKHALIAFSRAGDVDSVNDLFEKMVSQHGMPRSRRLVTPLLYVHARVGNVRETLRQFNRVPEEFGLRLNTVCWNILLTAYANAEDLSGCFKILRQMFDQHMDPNSHTFGIVMGLCANRGDIQGVRDLLELAKEYDVQITAPMIDTVVEAHCQNQEFEEAEEIAQTCLGLDIAGSRVRMWNVLLWNYAFRMDLEAIARVRSRMEEAALYPDGMTYAALMLSLVLVGKTESARRILRQLHRNNRAYATEFHYAIVLFGFVKSRNRDMVHVIFNEIQERFGEADLAARLLILKNQLRRDLQLLEHGGTDAAGAHNRLENAEKFLKETISEFHTRKMATKSPVLGAGRMSAKQAFPIAYYEHMMNAYGRRGASRRARELFDEYLQSQRISPSDDVAQVAPLRLLTALMLAHVRAFEKLELVEEYWDMAFKRAIKMISRPNIEAWFSNPSAPLPSEDDLLVWAEPRGDLSEANVGASDRGGFAILHAHRFMLSRALSLLMRSLAYRNEIGRISTVIMEVEKAGFVLTTHNWSTFVQLLASSGNESDQIEAFSLFEHKFMPNFPGWKYLRRGYGVKPHGVPSTIDSMEIKGQRGPSHLLGKEGKRYWSKIQPDFMQPTYVSMVYLAAALKQFRQKSIWKGAVDLEKINAVAPETLTAVAEMPRLGDKLQGVLLRGHEQRPERPPLERDQFVWTGGILRAGGLTKTYSYDEPLSEEPADEAQAAERVTEAEEVTDLEEAIPDIEEFRDLFRRTLERSDEFDLEVQAVVNRRRKAEGTTEELGDDE
ncbi:putative translation regulator (Cya5), partial [Aspergillus homomorphus CBS 101889]